MSDTTKKKKAPAKKTPEQQTKEDVQAAIDAFTGESVELGGRRYTIPAWRDLPFAVRMRVEGELMKSVPSADSLSGKPDTYVAALAAAEVVLTHAHGEPLAKGVLPNPRGEALDLDALSYEEQDQAKRVLLMLGLRVISQVNETGEQKNEAGASQTT